MALIDMSETYQMTNVGDHIDGTDVYQSNRNLLDNPWFTVNQRGATTVSAQNAYIADRWKVSGNTYTWTYGRAALSLTNSNNSLAYLVQALEPDLSADLNGKTVTFSVILDGTLYSVSFVWDKTARNYAVNIPNLTNIMFWYGGNGEACIRWITSGTFVVSAVKLELGSVSTLANDTPPDYGTELAKCQRYFERIKPIQGNYANFGMGYASTTTQAIIFVPMQPKRDYTYTVTASGSFRVSDSARNYTASAVAKESGASASNTLVLYVTTTGTAMTAGSAVMFGAENSNTCYIDISNDL